MLTGDKMETAENIAKSCKLIQPGFEVLRLKLDSKILAKSAKDLDDEQVKGAVLRELRKLVESASDFKAEGVRKALMIEGADLTHVLAFG